MFGSPLFNSLIQQESGGRPGVLGPRTKYGRAMGLTQMLPATAQEMARKLGVPWNPAMMTDTSPQGAAYQRQLGEAYFNEGLEKTGNERDALRYYHGGPNRSMWGPKTTAYADQVMARAQGPMPRPQTPAQTLGGAPAPQGVPYGFDSPDFGAIPQQMPVSEPMGGQQMAQLQPKPGMFGGKGKQVAATALSALGDALITYGTGQRYSGGMDNMNAMQSEERQQNFAREQLAAKIAADREEAARKAMEPPTAIQNANYFNNLPPEQQRAYVNYLDITQPIAVSGPQGTSRVARTLNPKAGAEEDGYIFLGGDPADPQNWKAR